jgi:hypothetical protein
MQTTNVTPPNVGTHVFGSDGEEIGTISDAQPGWFVIKKGTFRKTEIYVPLTAITGTALGGDGITIDLTKDEAESGEFSQPPTGETTSHEA